MMDSSHTPKVAADCLNVERILAGAAELRERSAGVMERSKTIMQQQSRALANPFAFPGREPVFPIQQRDDVDEDIVSPNPLVYYGDAGATD
ncbi:MAG TPA: hypothetical protein VGN72_24000 [Tepidisphaeraceae bacterium]|jgi:hypothetical protein|nr:hypothetical protein [Tepidisphaeraceae bacterium]